MKAKVIETSAAKRNHVVRKASGELREGNLLLYYVLDALRKMPEQHRPMLEACARKAGLLRENEPLAE